MTPRAAARRAAPASSMPLWLMPLALGGLQWYVSQAGAHQIRYEELAESVRNVFWLDERLVYDGISSNVGWYGLLLVVYKVAGFSMTSAKVVRLGLHVVGLYCAAGVLRRSMGARAAIVPLAVIGLSPAVLYFNGLQTSFGVDVAYAAICLWLISSIRTGEPRWQDLVRTFACGAIAMIAAMSYPSFLVYGPSVVLVWLWLSRRGSDVRLSGARQLGHGLALLAGCAVPAAGAWLYVQAPEILIFDPVTQAGLFRGGGGAIAWHWPDVLAALQTTLGDLVVRGQSYYFEVSSPDFAGPIGMVGGAAVVVMAVLLAVSRRLDRLPVSAALLLLVLSLVVPSLSAAGPAGIRRATGVLTAFFCLFGLVWSYWTTAPARQPRRALALALCLLVPLASALKLPSLVDDVRQKSSQRYEGWFAIQSTPQASLDYLMAEIGGGRPLQCPPDANGRISPCRYQEVYAALAGSFRWNRGVAQLIHAIDWKTGQDVVLTPMLWTSYYYPH